MEAVLYLLFGGLCREKTVGHRYGVQRFLQCGHANIEIYYIAVLCKKPHRTLKSEYRGSEQSPANSAYRFMRKPKLASKDSTASGEPITWNIAFTCQRHSIDFKDTHLATCPGTSI